MFEHEDLPIHNFSRLINVRDRILIDALYKLDNRDISIALLGAGELQRFKIFKNMSRRRAEMIKEDMIFFSKFTTKSAVKQAQNKVVDVINQTILDMISREQEKDLERVHEKHR